MTENARNFLAERAARAGMAANHVALVQAQQGRSVWTDADGAMLLMLIDLGDAHASGQHIDGSTREAAPGADPESRKADSPVIAAMQKALDEVVAEKQQEPVTQPALAGA